MTPKPILFDCRRLNFCSAVGYGPVIVLFEWMAAPRAPVRTTNGIGRVSIVGLQIFLE
jgi:hypothetical protein